MMQAQTTMVPVEITDKDGYPTGKHVQMIVDYLVDVDASYGEDADGRQGTPLVEYCFLCAYLAPSDRVKLTEAEYAWAQKEAETIFHQSDKHF